MSFCLTNPSPCFAIAGGNKHGDAASGEQPPAEAGITVQLRQQIADLTAKLAASEQKLTQLKEERESQFLINPSLGARPENEETVAQLVNDVKPHWEAISKEEAATVLKSWVPTFPGPHPVADTTFELSPPGVMVGWECATGKVKIVPPGPGRLVGFMPGMFPFCSLDTILSSPLLLYRMCCLFPIKLETDADSWKSVWTIYLRHKPTGAIAECFDAKGAGHMRLYAKTPDTPPVPPMILDMMMTNRLPLLSIFNSPEHAQLKQAQEDNPFLRKAG